jgi:hypothetical protein
MYTFRVSDSPDSSMSTASAITFVAPRADIAVSIDETARVEIVNRLFAYVMAKNDDAVVDGWHIGGAASLKV